MTNGNSSERAEKHDKNPEVAKPTPSHEAANSWSDMSRLTQSQRQSHTQQDSQLKQTGALADLKADKHGFFSDGPAYTADSWKSAKNILGLGHGDRHQQKEELGATRSLWQHKDQPDGSAVSANPFARNHEHAGEKIRDVKENNPRVNTKREGDTAAAAQQRAISQYEVGASIAASVAGPAASPEAAAAAAAIPVIVSPKDEAARDAVQSAPQRVQAETLGKKPEEKEETKEKPEAPEAARKDTKNTRAMAAEILANPNASIHQKFQVASALLNEEGKDGRVGLALTDAGHERQLTISRDEIGGKNMLTVAVGQQLALRGVEHDGKFSPVADGLSYAGKQWSESHPESGIPQYKERKADEKLVEESPIQSSATRSISVPADALQPAVRAEEPKPAVQAEAPKPAVPAEAPKPAVPAEAPKPAVPAEAPKPAVPAEAPKPAVPENPLDIVKPKQPGDQPVAPGGDPNSIAQIIGSETATAEQKMAAVQALAHSQNPSVTVNGHTYTADFDRAGSSA
jgi:hypothetical protein